MSSHATNKAHQNPRLTRDTVVRARISSDLKHEVDGILNNLGLNISEAISLYLSQIKLQAGIPFSIKIPNKKTLKTIEETEKGIGLIASDSIEDFFKKTGLSDAKNKTQKGLRKRRKAH